MATTWSVMVRSNRTLKLHMGYRNIVAVQAGTFPIYTRTNNRRHAVKTFQRVLRRMGKGVGMLPKTFKAVGEGHD